MITKTDAGKVKALNDQIRVSVTQAILSVIGAGHTIKILNCDISMDDLQPTGQEVTLRMTLNVYPKDN